MMHSKPWWLPSLLLALVLALPLAGSHSAVPTPHPDFADALWIAESSRGLKVALSDGRVLFEIPDTGRIEALILNEEAVLWAYGEGQLSVYDFSGRRLLTRPIAFKRTAQARGAKRAHLALNPLDGSLWLGLGRSLYHFDPTGEVLQQTQLQDPIRALGFDRMRTRLWVGFRRSLTAYDASGQPGQRIDIGRFGPLRDLAYDETLDALWVALKDHRVRRYAPERGEIQVDARLSEAPRRIAPDLQGGAWIAAGKHLLRVDGRGSERLKRKPFAGAEKDGTRIKALAVDAREGAVWIASRGAVREVDASGELKPFLALGADRPKLDLRALALYTDGIPPTIAITAPIERSAVATNKPLFQVRYEDRGIGIDERTLQWTANGNLLAVSCEARAEGATCTPIAALPEGLNTLQASIADLHGNRGQSPAIPFTVDTRPPEITLDVPPEWITNQAEQTLSGRLSEVVTLTLDGSGLALQPDLTFRHRLTLSEGPHSYTFIATDGAGHVSTATSRITLDTLAPPAPEADLVGIEHPEGGVVTVSGGVGSVEPFAQVTITNPRTGESVTVTADGDGSFHAEIAAAAGDVLHIDAADAAGNHGEYRPFAVPAPGGELPPDPATVAPPLDETEITPLHEATAFLYAGANPIQTGVAEGTIVPRRAAIVRGQVLSRDNQPLSGVTVTIKDHTEFGQTRSRADGRFDMAVNGGGLLTVNYEKPGYLPVQRQVQAPWQDFVQADHVVMVTLDPQVIAIDLSASTPMQVAQGSLSTDADGQRQATILFPQGTAATMTLPDGTTQALSTLQVRATEYTVGVNGPKAMPGPLPPSSGYTYAVELSVDEAIAAGAKRVDFNQPLPLYVDNFLDFPVGGIVPVGWYDRVKGAWIPSNNGRVIKILSTSGGIAGLDTDGDTLADDTAKLTALGITEAESTRLAGLYPAGKTLWRSPITHFTPWDCNWPYGPPPGAGGPNGEPPEGDDPPDSDDSDDCPGCSIEAQSQTLGEEIPITGTPFHLHYRSDRMPGRTSANTFTIPLSGASVPNDLKDIVLKIELAGRTFEQHFPAQANSTHTFTWDRKDAYGRPVAGRRTAKIRIGYTYRAVYYRPAQFARSFAMPSGGGGSAIAIIGDRARQEITLWRDSQLTVDGIQNALAGWSLSVQHVYDAAGGRLYKGDGGKRSANDINSTITTVVGNGTVGFSGDGGPATQARLNHPESVAPAADGSLYIADAQNSRIRRVGPDGVITTVAGNGTVGFSGDGGPATQAGLFYPAGVAPAADGSVYIADSRNHRIRRVGPDGVITTVAGNGLVGFSGDSGPATQARLDVPLGVALADDGSLYIADTYNSRIRRLGPDGVIITVAGNGLAGFSGDGGAATQARLDYPFGVAPAADGSVYIADSRNHRIRRVGPDGVIITVAGNGLVGFSGDGGAATQARLGYPFGVAPAADGSVYIADTEAYRIRRISSSLTGAGVADAVISSQDGRELYHFDAAGRHRRTVDAVTGADLYRFAYDGNGHLLTVTDRDGDITRVERDAKGDPTAIVSPDGQRTELTLNFEGYLASVTNPANETYRLDYYAGGLLKTVTDPEGHGDHFVYDATGRLVRNTNAGHGGWTIARTQEGRGYTASMTSAEGRTSSFKVEPLAIGDRRQVNTGPDGSVQTKLFKTNGEETTIATDGTVTTVLEGSDPRFGMQAPVPGAVSVKLPSGLTSNTTTARTAALSNPNDPFSLTRLTETVSVNGKTSTSAFNKATLTYTNTSPAGRVSTATVNDQHRPVMRQVTGLNAVNYTYDTRGRLTETAAGEGTEARATHITYYQSGPQKGYAQNITDALGRSVFFEYDVVGRLIKQTLPDSREVRFDYDAKGNLTALTPPGQPAHLFDYTALDQEKDYTPPVVDILDPATRYTYNRDKQLELITRPDGQVLDFIYDGAGRLQSLTAPHGETAYTYDGAGRLQSLTAPVGIVLTYGYDGGLARSETLAGPVTGTLTRRYDSDFRVQALSVNGANIAFGYDNDSRLISAGSLTLSRNAQNGLLNGTVLGNISDSRSYNGFGEVVDYSASHNSSALLSLQYTRDALGRITQKTETQGAPTTTFDYAYDLAGRFIEVKQNGVTTATYGYDQNGNRTDVNGVTVGQYDVQDRLTAYGDTRYTYTPNGELASKTTGAFTTSYRYDVLGNLRHITLPGGGTVDYLIDGRNRRVSKKLNGFLVQGFLYQDQLRPIAESDGNNQVVSRFVYADKPNVPAYLVKGGMTYRILSDHLGSPRLVVNADTGDIVQRMDYDEWGKVTLDTNPGFQPFGFAGGLYDRDTRLIRFGARDYYPETGRWTAKDPIRFRGGDSNLYGYVGGNPVSRIDPSGLLFGGAIDAGESFGDSAAQYWADLAEQTGNPLYNIPGAVAALWTPCTSDATASVLVGGAGIGRYLARPFWQYYPLENPSYSSPWLTRGRGWKPPHNPGPQAAERLSLPPHNPGTAARPANPPSWQPVRGPRPVEPQFGQPGGGWEYKQGWRW